MQAITEGPLPGALHDRAAARSPARTALVCGTGYTGEDGVELLLDPRDAAGVWDALVRRGATPAGLGARDTLRLEVCFHLYGNDLMDERGPIEAGLGWGCEEPPASSAPRRSRQAREARPEQQLVPFGSRAGDPRTRQRGFAGGGRGR